MSEELKPCPFDGSEVALGHSSGDEVYPQSWFVKCPTCGATQPGVYASSSWRTVKSEDDAAKEKVITAWNTRQEKEA